MDRKQKTEKSGQTTRSDQRPLNTTWFQFYLVPDNILTATSVFLVLPWKLLAVALATYLKAPFPTICFIVTCSLGISQELADLFTVDWTDICYHLWTSSVIQCHVMALRRFRQFDCNLKDKVVFNQQKITNYPTCSEIISNLQISCLMKNKPLLFENINE